MKQKFLLLVMACCSGAACCTDVALASDLYKWTDANGVVHFSDTPPPANVGKSSHVRVDKGVSADVNDAPPADPAKDAAKNAPPAAAPAPAVAPPAMVDSPENRARVCEQARANIELLQSKFQVADSSGKPLDATARQGMIDQAKQAAATSCTGG